MQLYRAALKVALAPLAFSTRRWAACSFVFLADKSLLVCSAGTDAGSERNAAKAWPEVLSLFLLGRSFMCGHGPTY